MSTTTTYYATYFFPDYVPANCVLGPVLKVTITGVGISDISVVSDGVNINSPSNLATEIFWLIDNNPSGLQLVLSDLTGQYQRTALLPVANNIAAYEADVVTDFSAWNGSYQLVDNKENLTGTLGITDGTVSYNGTTIVNPLFLSQAIEWGTITFLSWFTADGNEENVSISFNKTPRGLLNFFGFIWAEGENRPAGLGLISAYNLFGTTSTDAKGEIVADLAAAAVEVACYEANEAAKEDEEAEEEDAEDEAEDEAEDGEDAGEEAENDADAEAEIGTEDGEAGAEEATGEGDDAIIEATEEVTEVLIEVAAIAAEADMSAKLEYAPKGKSGGNISSLLKLKNK